MRMLPRKTSRACRWMNPCTANAQTTCSTACVLRSSARPSSRPAQATHLFCVRRHGAKASRVLCSRSCSHRGLPLSAASRAATKKGARPPPSAAQLGADLRHCSSLCCFYLVRARLTALVALGLRRHGSNQLYRVAPYVNRSEWPPCKRPDAHRVNSEEAPMCMAINDLSRKSGPGRASPVPSTIQMALAGSLRPRALADPPNRSQRSALIGGVRCAEEPSIRPPVTARLLVHRLLAIAALRTLS